MSFEAFFFSAEEEAFRFLDIEHGFVRVERQVGWGSSEHGVFGHAAYRATESSAGLGRAVSLRIAPLRLELELHISKWASGPYSIEELHALDGQGPFPRREHGLYDAMHDCDELLSEFMRLAGILRACGTRFFDDEPELWEELAALRQRRAEVETIKQTLALSQERFRAGDWRGVVALLSPIERRLGRAATARLVHARKKLQG